jgi:hypothetical protein
MTTRDPEFVLKDERRMLVPSLPTGVRLQALPIPTICAVPHIAKIVLLL